MQRRDLVIGIIVILVVAAIVLFIQRRKEEIVPPPIEVSTPSIEEREADLEDKFKITIPDNLKKADLKGSNGSGIATKDDAGELTVLVDLPDPESGKYYEAWVRRGGELVSLGRLNVAKGGYLLDTRVNATDSNEIVISLEATNDGKIETTVLQGSF